MASMPLTLMCPCRRAPDVPLSVPVAAGACDGVLCPRAAEGISSGGCPVDSVLKLSRSSRPDCCPPVEECVCDLESCPRRPKCHHGQPTLLRAGERRPGRCCSIWTCKIDTGERRGQLRSPEVTQVSSGVSGGHQRSKRSLEAID